MKVLDRLGTWPALGILLALVYVLPKADRGWAWVGGLIALLALLGLGRRRPSRVEMGLMGFYVIGAGAAFLAPAWFSSVLLPHTASAVNGCLVLSTGLPRFFGAEPFTMAYARRSAPSEHWDSEPFFRINLWLSRFWVGLFLLAVAAGLLFGNHPLVFILPVAIGILLNRRFPPWYLARMRRGG